MTTRRITQKLESLDVIEALCALRAKKKANLTPRPNPSALRSQVTIYDRTSELSVDKGLL